MAVRKLVSKCDSRRLALLAGVGSTVVALSGCESITGTPPVSLVRVIDTSSHAGGVDVSKGSSILAYNLDFGTITTYIPVVPGTYTINVDHAGTQQHLVRRSGSFAAGAQSTVLIGDDLAGMRQVLLRDQTQPAPVGQVSLRMIDESARSGAVDVYLVPSGSTVGQVRPLLTDVVSGQNTGYLNVPAGTYTLVIEPAGTKPDAAEGTLFTGASISYAAGCARTILLIDQAEKTTPGLQTIIAEDYDVESLS